MSAYILDNCFGVNADDAFGMDDFYGDLDAFYLISKFKGGSRKLSAIMEDYFTADLSDEDRAIFYNVLHRIASNLQTLSKEGLPKTEGE